MKRPTMLYQAMLRQLSMDLEVSVERDYTYLCSRYEHEGLSFLTITLPTLSDSLEAGLESGLFTLPSGFKSCRRGGTLPAFLQGLFKRVFSMDGSLSSDPCHQSIYWIRQISRFFKKPKIACSPEREALAIRRFRAIEEDLNAHNQAVNRQDNLLDEVARILWSAVFPTVNDHRIICGHGPGVTADRRRSNERRRIRYWYQRHELHFPSADHAFHNYGEAWSGGSDNGVAGLRYLDLLDEPPVRVVFVPKTLSSPRVIAIEPSSMQFVQQGIARYMMRIIESHSLTRNSVRFTDQEPNRRLAYEASKHRKLATIDLSDASDRVHLELVNRIFRSSPILEYLQDSRSLHADLPDGSNLILHKYASMGSALCFPVEACVFYTLVLTAIIRASGKRPCYSTIRSISRKVSVFGDDIIIPSEYTDVVSEYLESFALRVNRRKSFSKSAFRESCGADYFEGTSVLPVYARQLAPDRRSEWTPSHIMSWISTADQFYLTGKWHICQVIRDMVEDVLKRKLPRSRRKVLGLGFASLLFDTELRFDKPTYAFKQRRLVYRPSKRKDNIDGDPVACFNKVFERSNSQAINVDRYDTPMEWTYLSSETQDSPLWADLVLALRPQSDDVARTEGIDRERVYMGVSALYVGSPASAGPQRYDIRVLRDATRPVLDVDPSRIDFHNTTKRGVFSLTRRWVTIVS